ncbi:MAG: hypothetical protein U0Q03_18335 [Acidimicrobiales bacterium]
MTDDPQDIAEQLDEDVTDTDPGNPEQNGPFGLAPDDPVAVDEEQVTEPIVDSVASRDDRLQPEAFELDDQDDLDDLDGSDDRDLEVVLSGGAIPSEEDVDPIELDVDRGDLAGDPSDLAPEEAALHVIDDGDLG